MNELEKKEGTQNILWLLLGVFIIPTINGVEGLLNGILKWSGLSITYRLLTSIVFDSVFLIGLIIAIVQILRHGPARYSKYFDISLNKFRLYGLIFLSIIIAGRVTNYFIITDYTKEIKLLESDARYELLHESTYYYLTSSILTTAREILLFVAFFVATIRKLG